MKADAPDTLHLRPAKVPTELEPFAVEGRLVVVDPQTRQALPAKGAHVRPSVYWRRALRRGDVELVDAADKPATPKRSAADGSSAR